VVLLLLEAADHRKLVGVLRRELELAPLAANPHTRAVTIDRELLIGALLQ
jgi:hypothetical protein